MSKLSSSFAILLAGWAVTPPSGAAEPPLQSATQPYPSTYQAAAHPPTLIRGATVLTGAGARIDDGDVLFVNGRIEAVGRDLQAPADALTIEAQGRWVTPGLIDVHSHLGVYANPNAQAHADGNEMTNPLTANVWAEHSIWPQDPGFQAALEGGVTTLHILPGSANLVGGRTAVVKNVTAVSYQAMKFPDAPYGVKMACGENPKSVYGEQGRTPATRMGNIAGFRQAFLDAQDYQRQWEKYARDLQEYERSDAEQNDEEENAESPAPPRRDLNQETLAGVLNGDIRVHVHCYRADDMMRMLDLASEFGFRIAAFHHAVDAYKIAEPLARQGVCAALWADWWGFKMEAYDGIQANLALVDRPANSCSMIHSDSAEGIQRLNQEAAKGMARGVSLGLSIPPERAIRWITSNPARALGLSEQIGALERDMMADVVIWSRNPFSVYALADQVFIDGVLTFDRRQAPAEPRSDFLLGQPGQEGAL